MNRAGPLCWRRQVEVDIGRHLAGGFEISVERDDRLPKLPTEVIDNPRRAYGNSRNGEAWRYVKQQGLACLSCEAAHWFGGEGDDVSSKSDAYPETAPARGDLPIRSAYQDLADFQQINFLRSARLGYERCSKYGVSDLLASPPGR